MQDERFFRRHCLFWLWNRHRAFRKFADVSNSDRHDFLLLLAYQPHPPWLAIPTWNDVLSSSWWNRSMCGPLLMLASHYTDTRFVTMARTGGLSWYRLGIWPCTRYGGRDRGESGVSASCTPSTSLYRVYSTGYRVGSTRYKRRGVIKPNRIGNHHVLSCKLWLAGPFPSLNSC